MYVVAPGMDKVLSRRSECRGPGPHTVRSPVKGGRGLMKAPLLVLSGHGPDSVHSSLQRCPVAELWLLRRSAHPFLAPTAPHTLLLHGENYRKGES